MSEIAVALFIAVLVYAATRIPALGDALGRAVRGPPPESPPPPPTATGRTTEDVGDGRRAGG